MDFDFSSDQVQLREDLRRFMISASPRSCARAVIESDATMDHEVWEKIVEMGITRLSLPESLGGFGMGIIEQCIAAAEQGRQLAPVPSIASLYLAQQLLLQLPASEAREHYLHASADGNIFSVAAPIKTPWKTTISMENGALNGHHTLVLHAADADYLLVYAHCDDGTPVIAACEKKNVDIEPQPLIDASMSAAKISFKQTPCSVLAKGSVCEIALATTLNRAACLLSFEQMGACDAAFEMANEYAKERQAFGRAIGSYQAIKHKLVDLYTQQQLAHAHCLYAAWALHTNDAALPKAAASALLSSQQALTAMASENIHIHGGMGYTWELDCHLFFKRARFYASVLGNQHLWHARLGNELVYCDTMMEA
ncbi:MAG: hypothetical protein RL336_1964 [Pseudomonadota bacterium]|jgi:alkylation response protein AidB-like acyl-CoA dehydrogenase